MGNGSRVHKNSLQQLVLNSTQFILLPIFKAAVS